MTTLQPRRCDPRAWREWCVDGLRLVLRTPVLFIGWMALCLLRGWLITQVLGGENFLERQMTLLALSLPEPGIGWIACRIFTRRMRPGRRGWAWVRENLHSLFTGPDLWRMLLLLWFISLLAAWTSSAAASWGDMFSGGIIPVFAVIMWFDGGMRINVAEWTGLPFNLASALALSGRRLNMRGVRISGMSSLVTLVVLMALPVGQTLEGQAVLAGVAVFGGLFAVARDNCAMHDIFNTGEKVEEKQRSTVPRGRLAGARA